MLHASPDGMSRVLEAARAPDGRGLPPVHLWHPSHCGEIDILIRADGVWMHEGSPIGRPELVRLFSTVLRQDPDGLHLVTPVEKLRVRAEDLPFRAVSADRRGEDLVFVTDVGDVVTADAEHPLVVDLEPETREPRPRLKVRADLWARVTRPVFYQLVDWAEPVGERLAVHSAGESFDLGAT
jgi:uncharacterized protein